MIKNLLKIFVAFITYTNAYCHEFYTVDELVHYGIELTVKLHCKKAISSHKKSFLKNEMYNDSIFKVIPKAFADCIMNKNEFKDSSTKTVIEFQYNDYDNYTVSNMSALLLYNYLHALHCDYFLYLDKDSYIIDSTKQRIIDNIKLSDEAKIKLDKAVYNIQKYLQNLSLAVTKKSRLKYLFNEIQYNVSSW